MTMKLVDSFAEFKNIKSVDEPTLVRVLEDVFRTLIRKKYGVDDNFDIIVNDKDDLQIWRRREIVPNGEVEDERYQISISDAIDLDAIQEEDRKRREEARKKEEAKKRRKAKRAGIELEEEEETEKTEEKYDPPTVGEDFYQPVTLLDFGRRAIMAARQTLISRILELEKDKVYKTYVDKVGEFVVGEVHQTLKRELVVIDDATGSELILPKMELIRGDRYKKGDVIRAVVKGVEMKNNNPMVILSRTSEVFLERLLEQEVPEIEDGLITIRRIVRIPGERAKVAVESYDERIDPVGACVGMKGSRIHGIVRELNNENIDIINYTTNEELFIQRSLTPAKVLHITLDQEKRHASVYLRPEEISKAIGKRGVNIKLAGKLSDFVIDVFREGYDDAEYDIELDEFRDEIEGWMIEEFKRIGCDTARSVLDLTTEELLRRTELEEEMIQEVRGILQSEFEQSE